MSKLLDNFLEYLDNVDRDELIKELKEVGLDDLDDVYYVSAAYKTYQDEKFFISNESTNDEEFNITKYFMLGMPLKCPKIAKVDFNLSNTKLKKLVLNIIPILKIQSI